MVSDRLQPLNGRVGDGIVVRADPCEIRSERTIHRLLRRRRTDRPRPSDAARTGGQIASSRSPTVPRSSRSASTAAVVSRVSVKGVGARFPAAPLAVGSRVGEDHEVLVVGVRPPDQPDANAVVGTSCRPAPGTPLDGSDVRPAELADRVALTSGQWRQGSPIRFCFRWGRRDLNPRSTDISGRHLGTPEGRRRVR